MRGGTITPEKTLDDTLDTVCEWGKQFVKTHYFETLTDTQKQEAENVLFSYAEHMYTNHGLPPDHWNSEALKEVCVNTLPEVVIAEKNYFESLSPVLSAFFKFLAERNLLPAASELAETVDTLNKEIVQNALNTEHWNAAKIVGMAAQDAGVDLDNKKERKEFLENLKNGLLADNIVKKVIKENKDVLKKGKTRK
ncbi:MAG: hypothetical protein PVF58_18690 [Candidatus Methanofastidiosia archaeon]|jgi:hypothetical protein